MPKRKYPFGDSVPVQLKTHIGFNQAATEADKRAMYERTKALLFLGSNPQLKLIHGDSENVPPSSCSKLPERLFDDMGAPTMNGSANGSSEAISSPSQDTIYTQQQGILKYLDMEVDPIVMSNKSLSCGSCNREGVKLVVVCVQCGRQVCGVEGCLRECHVCHQVLCQICTVLNYNDGAVRTSCFDCLPTIT